MKQSQISLIVIGFILVALMATNPSTEEHKEAIKEKVSAAFENNNSDGNAFQKLGEQLGQTIGMALIDKMIKRDNYLLFSLTKSKFLNYDEKEKVVGLGILGKVYLANEFSEKITEKIKESNNPIIGNTIKIQNIEVAEKDFPKEMNWEDAKKECENLGSGWRLPTKDELNILFQNKDKIGGFSSTNYWSSTEDVNVNLMFYQDFDNGGQYYNPKYDKNGTYYVRAIRSF
jgi:hypothetical protein